MSAEYDKYIIPLYQQVKINIYLSYEEMLYTRGEMEKYPSPPNILAFKTAVLNCYDRLRSKLISSLNNKELKDFKDIAKSLESISSARNLRIETALKMIRRIGDYLDSIGITKINIDKVRKSDLYNYNS